MTNTHFSQMVAEQVEIIRRLRDDFTAESREQTALRLEGLHYSPPVITPVSAFLRMDRTALLKEIDRILAMPDQEACALAPDNSQECEDLRLGFIRVITFYYAKLILLRQGNIEEWEEVDELYVHD